MRYRIAHNLRTHNASQFGSAQDAFDGPDGSISKSQINLPGCPDNPASESKDQQRCNSERDQKPFHNYCPVQ